VFGPAPINIASPDGGIVLMCSECSPMLVLRGSYTDTECIPTESPRYLGTRLGHHDVICKRLRQDLLAGGVDEGRNIPVTSPDTGLD